MKKLKVAVLAGGRSAERQISIASGREVVANLDKGKYDVLPVYIAKDGKWNILPPHQISLLSPAGEAVWSSEVISDEKLREITKKESRKLLDYGIDLVFIALHGPFGEDGTVQGMLEFLGVPYTGSGVLASALGMDKIASRKLFVQAGLTVPKYQVVKKGQNPDFVWQALSPPGFVKPQNLGSSVGGSIVQKREELIEALENAYFYSDVALVEEYLDGTEVTCGILGNDKPKALPLVEIVPKTDFFSYEAKYNEKLCDEICPARISSELARRVQEAAITAYCSLGCCAFGRVDMIIKNDSPYVLEVNTIPGLTSVSLLPKAAAAAGISYPQLLDSIIDFSLKN